MENRNIYLKQALDILNTRMPDNSFARCNIGLRTFNGQTGKGGKYIFYENVRLLPEANHDKAKKATLQTVLEDVKVTKRPNHFKNRTRNIELPDGSVRKIRIDFIVTINNYYVIY